MPSSPTSLAAKAGIDKSALLRYFETREQIFLELTAREWAPWVRDLHDGLDGAAPGSAGLVADVVARSFADRPLFCDLLAHTPLNLERNVSPATVRSYKLTSLGAVDDAAALVHAALPDLTVSECREFISALASLAGSVWQIATPRPRSPSCSRPTRRSRLPASTWHLGCGEPGTSSSRG